MKPLRSLIGILLIAGTLLPAQQLKLRQTRAFAIEEMEPPPLLANERFEPQQADQSGTTAKSGAATAGAARASKGKSSKKKWIIIGAVAGAVVITSLLVYKRLDNENFFN